MIVTLCVKCRCVTSLFTGPVVNTKTMVKDQTKFVAITCAACKCSDSDTAEYEASITPDHILSMQEWTYVVKYAAANLRVLNINAVGEHVVVFGHQHVVPPSHKVTRSVPIVTCKHHAFHVHDY